MNNVIPSQTTPSNIQLFIRASSQQYNEWCVDEVKLKYRNIQKSNIIVKQGAGDEIGW